MALIADNYNFFSLPRIASRLRRIARRIVNEIYRIYDRGTSGDIFYARTSRLILTIRRVPASLAPISASTKLQRNDTDRVGAGFGQREREREREQIDRDADTVGATGRLIPPSDPIFLRI